MRIGCWTAQKIVRNWLRRFKNTRLKFDSIYLTDESPVEKKIQFGEKSPKSDVYELN
jgi:hypothetical protein